MADQQDAGSVISPFRIWKRFKPKKHFDRDKLMQKMQPGTVGVIRYNSKREIILQRVLSMIL